MTPMDERQRRILRSASVLKQDMEQAVEMYRSLFNFEANMFCSILDGDEDAVQMKLSIMTPDQQWLWNLCAKIGARVVLRKIIEHIDP